MKDHGQTAREFFFQGYNCAQAVACAFAEEMGVDVDTAAKLASSFGGGMGRMREVCGTVSGALLVLGALQGYSDPNDPELKKAHYTRVQDFAARFRAEHGSIVCRELLAGLEAAKSTSPEAEARTPEFYKKRPCVRYVESAARIAGEMLAENSTIK